MKLLLIIVCSIFSYVAIAQNESKFRLQIELQPELTIYRNSYPDRGDTNNKISPSLGGSLTLQYRPFNRCFVSGGIGAVQRIITGISSPFNHGALPDAGPIISFENRTTKMVNYNTLFIPIQAGYKVFKTREVEGFVVGEYTANYLLSGDYYTTFGSNEGTYQKRYWQGHSMNVGLSTLYRGSKNMQLVGSIFYSIKNTTHKDKFINSHSGNLEGDRLSHSYLRCSMGVHFLL